MIARTKLQLLAIGAIIALGTSGAAEARGHASRDSGPRGGAVASGFRHGAPIAFSARGYERSASRRSVGYFAGRSFGRFHFGRGEAVAFDGGHSSGAAYEPSTGHSGGGIQCVTFARADTGIELSGNASAWWYNAAGVYQRGGRPEAGAVLNFRANGSMRMGHVAVVNQVMNSRTINIDHANWGGPGAVRGGVSRDISVVDVSPNNDWTAVRVALGHTAQFGSIYPTYGFIYNRPDAGTMVAANDSAAPVPALNAAPRDLRGRVAAPAVAFNFDEVAEAPDSAEPRQGYGRHHFAGRRFEGSRFAARGTGYGVTPVRAGRHMLLATTAHHHAHRA